MKAHLLVQPGPQLGLTGDAVRDAQCLPERLPRQPLLPHLDVEAAEGDERLDAVAGISGLRLYRPQRPAERFLGLHVLAALFVEEGEGEAPSGGAGRLERRHVGGADTAVDEEGRRGDE